MESEQKQKHFVLIHGACHGAWCWYKVSALLKSAGHKVTALDLAASGVNPKQVHQIKSVADYFEPLTEFMDSLPSEERVILVGHSFGGVAVCDAMERFSDKISAAVFATATMPGPELSYNTVMEEYSSRITIDPSIWDTKLLFDDGPNNPPTARLSGPKTMSACLYQLSPPEDLMLGMMSIRPFPIFSNEAVESEVKFSKEKYGSVARVYIVCGQDHIVNEDLQRWMIHNNPPNEIKFISDSDHMVMFSQPQEFCSCLLEIASKYF
ncbi:methyl jasmonate esterase 1-like [Mercurialis annua]|uniref:methyl jasmonate esterase 1-like n=1 Tax=Mercurialis annua TaxID=3986 RepID=UPI00215EFB64|nr:methyl jasmonate esterase 1-like [Mercurialis annua]